MPGPTASIYGQAASAAGALEVLDNAESSLIILEVGIEGDLMGLDAVRSSAPRPLDKILLFTGSDMHREADAEPVVDGYVRKDRIDRLVPTGQWLR